MKTLFARLAAAVAPVRKAVGSVLGGATGVGVAAVLDAVGWHLPTTVDAAIAVVLGAAGAYIAPANATKASAPAASPAGPATTSPPA